MHAPGGQVGCGRWEAARIPACGVGVQRVQHEPRLTDPLLHEHLDRAEIGVGVEKRAAQLVVALRASRQAGLAHDAVQHDEDARRSKGGLDANLQRTPPLERYPLLRRLVGVGGHVHDALGLFERPRARRARAHHDGGGRRRHDFWSEAWCLVSCGTAPAGRRGRLRRPPSSCPDTPGRPRPLPARSRRRDWPGAEAPRPWSAASGGTGRRDVDEGDAALDLLARKGEELAVGANVHLHRVAGVALGKQRGQGELRARDGASQEGAHLGVAPPEHADPATALPFVGEQGIEVAEEEVVLVDVVVDLLHRDAKADGRLEALVVFRPEAAAMRRARPRVVRLSPTVLV